MSAFELLCEFGSGIDVAGDSGCWLLSARDSEVEDEPGLNDGT